MKIHIFFATLLLPLLVGAQSPSPENLQSATKPAARKFVLEERGYWGMMGLAVDARIQRDQDQNTDTIQAPSFSVGVGYKSALGILEYVTFDQARQGNEALNVRRSSESAMIWGQYFTDDEWLFRPYFGIGLGGFRQAAVTEFLSEKREDRGLWNEIYGGAFGFRWASFSPVWLTLEGRVLFSREIDPSPTLGALLKIGFVLE